MKRLALALTLLAFAAPSAATAAPDRDDERNAARECSSVRSEMGRSDFAREFGTARTGRRDAFGRCVSRFAAQEERERGGSDENAAQECKDKGLQGREFGECVSSRASAKKDDADERNAAFTCRRLRRQMGTSDFDRDFGTRRSGFRNAFGRCVSSMAPQHDD